MNSFTDWDSELYHHGIKGQKWGVRRYQNEDGSLTAEGQARYDRNVAKTQEKLSRYKQKESAYEEKGHAKAERVFQKRIDRLTAKSDKAKLKGKIPKAEKTDKKIADLKEQQDLARAVHKRVMDKLQNLSYEGMQKEKKQAGKQAAAQILAGAAASTVVFFASGGMAIPLVVPSSLKANRSEARNIDAASEIVIERINDYARKHGQ